MAELTLASDELDAIVDSYIDGYGAHLRMKYVHCEVREHIGDDELSEVQFNDLCARIVRAATLAKGGKAA